MAHNLMYSEKLGRHAAWFADTPGWHNLGLTEQGLQVWRKVAERTDMEYDLEVRQLEWGGKPIDAYGTFRLDTDAFFGTCGKNYAPIPPRDAFDFVDTVLGEMDGAHYSAAGQLGNGSQFWVLAKIPEDFKIGDDEHKTYLGFVSSHDGSMAAAGKFSDIRWVCQNTINMGLRANGKEIKIRHTKNAKERLDQAKRILQGTSETVRTLHERMDFLSKRTMTKEGFKEITDRLFPVNPEAKHQTKRDNMIIDILNVYENNDGNAFPEFKGTAYNLLNAIVEHTDHYRTAKMTEGRKYMGDSGARADSALFGTGATLKDNALEVIYEVAQNLPYKTHVQRAIGSGDYTGIKPIDPPVTGLLDSILESHEN